MQINFLDLIKKTAIGSLLLAVVAGSAGGIVGWKLADITYRPGSNTVFVDSGSGSIADVVEAAGKSVVSINVSSVQTVQSFFYGEQQFNSQSAGTGFIVSADGLVVTNKHVVGNADSEVTLVDSEGKIYENVTFVGSDPLNDIAFLKIKGAKDLDHLDLGDSSTMRPGDEVIAIGNALGQFANTVTRGIISGIGRPLTGSDLGGTTTLVNLFQTDASINQGNSGGPLLNAVGQVIGINTAVAGQAENIGFAIPINDIAAALESIIETGKLQRPYLGISYIAVSPELAKAFDLKDDYGALIDGAAGQVVVLPDSPADKAGIKKGDIILQVNDVKVELDRPLSSILNEYRVGNTVSLKIVREDQTIERKVILEAAPETS